jgi:hypothetical protein
MTTVTLSCPECRRENEPERIYCHQCGARLDRSGLAAHKPSLEGTDQIHRRLRRMFNPQRGRLRRVSFAFGKVLLGACVAAGVVEMILPADIGPVSKDMQIPPQINFDLENAAVYHRPAQLRYTQKEVNAYLAYTLKGKQRRLGKSVLKLDRTVVGLGEGRCTVTVERSVFGYPIYQRASYALNLKGGKIAVSYKGGWIGQLPIAPSIMPYAGIVFADVWSVFKRERNLIVRMSGIEFHDGYVILTAPTH